MIRYKYKFLFFEVIKGGKMKELTVVIDDWGHKELKEHLLSLNGILDVAITNKDVLEIYIKYNSNLIDAKIIRFEIMLFLNILKVPSMLTFDKHSIKKTEEYQIIRKNICCEYCFKSTIEELFEIEGIQKVESNFMTEKISNRNSEKIIININYDPILISFEEIKELELNLNI